MFETFFKVGYVMQLFFSLGLLPRDWLYPIDKPVVYKFKDDRKGWADDI